MACPCLGGGKPKKEASVAPEKEKAPEPPAAEPVTAQPAAPAPAPPPAAAPAPPPAPAGPWWEAPLSGVVTRCEARKMPPALQERYAAAVLNRAAKESERFPFRLIFGRAIIPRSGLEAWMLSPERARAEHSR